MLFNSPIFIFLFLPIAIAGLYLIGRFGTHLFAVVWLIVISTLFYGWSNALYLPLLAALVAFNYLCGAKLARDCRSGQRSPALLACGIVINLGVLVYFKYTAFLVANANVVLGTHFGIGAAVLPLGISFFIFQKIAYLADSHRGETSSYTPLEFSLFVMFFPQLIAGPIVHHSELIPQLRHRLRVSAADLSAGLTLFTIGLLKKIVLADPLASYADVLFSASSAGQGQPMVTSWSAALTFTFQIYFDFSGYTDMALGLALMMGIRLPPNFDSPYKALNIIDFWRRWHMTLSRFLRDYVYIPLGGNRHGPPRRYVNLMITMLLGGLWHGAAWTFVAWGALHGLYLVINHGWHAARRGFGWREGRFGSAGHWMARLLTFVAVVVAWVLFRAQSFDAAKIMLKGMAGFYGIAPASATAVNALPFGGADRYPVTLAFLAILLLGVWALPNSLQILAAIRPAKSPNEGGPPASIPWPVRPGPIEGRWALTAPFGFMVGVALLGAMIFQALTSTNLQNFIYFQF
jgi:alginate O-acetyltransferase complex protein AlgI